MKKLLILLFSISATLSNAQVKVFTGGHTIVGSTSPPLSGAAFQVAGPTFFSTATGTVVPTSAAFIRSRSSWSNDSTPDYTWYGEDLTGFFHPSVYVIGLTINKSEKFRFNSSGQILNGNASSSVSTPEYSWKNDPNTGIYRPGNDILGFVANGSEKMRINSSGQVLNSNSSSSVSTPDFSWNSDANTGIYRPGNDILGFVANGSEKMRINSSGQLLNSNTSSSASTPDFSWNSDANTGLYRPANDNIGFVTNGSEKMRLISTGSLLINTTSQGASGDEKLRVVAASGDYLAARFDVNHSSDYKQSVVTYTNRALSANYAVNYGGTDNFYVAGAGWIYSQGNYLGSDLSIKDNVATISNALSRISSIRGVTYKLKKEQQNPSMYPVAKSYMGVIAQEVEAVAPEAVKTMHDGTKAVCYEMLVGLLIEGVKEQNQKIAQLENQLAQCCTKAGTGIQNRSSESPVNPAGNENTSWLAQNKPNPFNKETVIEYNVVQEGKAGILVFDMNGKLLKTIPVKIPGKGSILINANDFSAGMYYYSLVVNDTEVDTKKMILTE